MTPDQIWQLGLTVASIMYGIYSQIHIHRIHKELKKQQTVTFGLRITVDKSGQSDPVVTLYRAPNEIGSLSNDK